MHATVRLNEGVVGNWTDGLGRETGEAVVRDLLEFEGFRSHDKWMRQQGANPPKVTYSKVRAEHVRVVPSPQPSVRKPREAYALLGKFPRRTSIQSTRRGFAARVGKK